MKKKQMTAILLLAMLSLSITACGDDNAAKGVGNSGDVSGQISGGNTDSESSDKESSSNGDSNTADGMSGGEQGSETEASNVDYSMFEGAWLGETGSEYDYVVVDEKGNWQIFSDDKVVKSGNMTTDGASYYIYCTQDNASYSCSLEEDGDLYFDTFGSFYTSKSNVQYIVDEKLASFSQYFDFWYVNGDMNGYCILIDAAGFWEYYDQLGLLGTGAVKVDEATNQSLVLLDEAGKPVASVQETSDILTVTSVSNAELFKVPEASQLYREIDSK